jgi:hypothetical protein
LGYCDFPQNLIRIRKFKDDFVYKVITDFLANPKDAKSETETKVSFEVKARLLKDSNCRDVMLKLVMFGIPTEDFDICLNLCKKYNGDMSLIFDNLP